MLFETQHVEIGPKIAVISDATAEAKALTQDLFGWKQKRKQKQLNQTASASRYYIDHIF